MKKAKEYCIVILTLIYIFLLIIYSKEISIHILKSIKTCIYTIIPSLYIFMIVSDFIITSNIYTLFSKPFSFISKYIFRIPEHFFPIYIINNIGGYPIGAKLISDMLYNNKIDVKTAEDMMTYCYLSGPAFIFGIVSTYIFSDLKTGIIILISILLSNFIIAVIIGLKRSIPKSSTYSAKLNLSINNFILSIYNGGQSIFKICAIIIFFSSLICIFENSGIISYIARIIEVYTELDYSTSIACIKSLFEISNISLFESETDNIPLIASLLSFGGLCIIFQIKSIIPKLSIKRFIIFRIASIILSYLICNLICFITYYFLYPVFSPAIIAHSQNSPIITVFLLIMTILFLLKFSIEKENKIWYNKQNKSFSRKDW